MVNNEGLTKNQGAKEVWLVPPREPSDFGVFGEEAVKMKEKIVFTPILTFEQKVQFNNPLVENIQKIFIRCLKTSNMERFEQKAIKNGWKIYGIAAGHDAMITHSEELFKIIEGI